MNIEGIEQKRRVQTGATTDRELLAYYADPSNDHFLIEEDTELIGDLVWRVDHPEREKRYFVNAEPIIVPAEGYWLCPYRQVFEEIIGEGGVRTEINVWVARTAMEAIDEGKRWAFNASHSDVRNLHSTEVLLSGPLKFEGQRKPRWINVRLMTEEQEARMRDHHLIIMRKLGYEPI